MLLLEILIELKIQLAPVHRPVLGTETALGKLARMNSDQFLSVHWLIQVNGHVEDHRGMLNRIRRFEKHHLRLEGSLARLFKY